ncbi:uncharacterized protein [Lepeophtheirus salmonis]|uniref:uncharacterized protein n=1 Tax=Lepeophtheirus salmonis TaxID=72036 RepID=UPI001AE56EE6|nr:uncharacterized protein LOC121131004 [Lepeophtheirus salmonis]
MKCFIIVALVLVGTSTSESSTSSMSSLLFEGSWLEMKEHRTNVVEYLTVYGISSENATKYSNGPTTMECIQLTEDGYKVNGIRPDSVPYNMSITWRKEEKRVYTYPNESLFFDAEVVRDNISHSHNVMLFNVYYDKMETPIFIAERKFTNEGYMNYSHTNVGTNITTYTLYKKQD